MVSQLVYLEPPKLEVNFYEPKHEQKESNTIKPLTNPFAPKKEVKVESPVHLPPKKIVIK